MVFGADSPLYDIVSAGGLCDIPEDFGLSLPEGYGEVEQRECEQELICNITTATECLNLVDSAMECG